MKPRLIRALQRGGVASQVRTEAWGVWRTQDRRGRVIGHLNGTDIDILRFQNNLKPVGTESQVVLVWSGERELRSRPTDLETSTILEAPSPNLSVLEALFRKTPSPDIRARLRRGCEAFRNDLESASAVAGYLTMNWDRLGAEARTHRPVCLQNPNISHESRAARTRLNQLAHQFTDLDLSILELTVMREVTRLQLAKAHGLRPVLAERRAQAILHDVSAFYETRVTMS